MRRPRGRGLRAGHDDVGRSNQKHLSGVAGGALINGAECAWITESDGARIDIAYPVGWTWTVQPLRVVDPRGRLGVQSGDHVSVAGVFAEVGESLCHVGRLFDATEVVAGS